MYLPSVNETKSDGVSPDTKWTPLLANSLGKTNDSCFGSGIVGLTNVSVKSGCGGDVGDRTVLSGFRLLRTHTQ